MAYYATVRQQGNPRRVCWAAGPYNTHGAAMAAVEKVRDAFHELDRDAHWHAYGTAHRGADRRVVGKLNDRVGYRLDRLP